MKNLKCLIVEPGMAPKIAEIENTLQAKQQVVGGLIEPVFPPSHPDDVCLICNEEGKLSGLPLNRAIRLENGLVYDIIAGTFLIVRAPLDSDEFDSLTDMQIDFYSQMYA